MPVRNPPMSGFRARTSPLRAATTLLAASAAVGWPLAVFHGWARWAVFSVWLGLVVAVTALLVAGNVARTRPRPRRPTR